ncbi:putative FAD dependent oxidoreductase [Aureobasidium sp. EXF-8845]|nr:putative FAD dependent oxidoreductase [Aureobasidium sp. EXF-8845]KAI4844358.1 putative FAD dependent oxidoreductase [Aureobasidium sp. EXF-8846]
MASLNLRHTALRSVTNLSSRQSRKNFSSTALAQADFTHAVIGGGAVGLAIARRLQNHNSTSSPTSTVLIEQHKAVGTETSSRNSEVIHAGIYYGPDSLKTRLCVQGKEMMYQLCDKHHIPYNNCGKWVVAQDETQAEAVEKVHNFAESIGVPTRFLSAEEVQRREPDVRAKTAVLESPTTGILDSHAYMTFLHAAFEDAGGDTALGAKVTRVESPSPTSPDWKIYTADSETEPITAEILINSAGLYACDISNMILPEEKHVQPFYAKGNYFSYAAGHPKPGVLVYPAPVPGQGGLGTHLTLDMGGRIRFGPDVEWVDSPTSLTPTSDPTRFAAAIADIRKYLPGIDESAIALDYAGIRPKLGKMGAVGAGKGFQDFYIKKEEGYEGFVNLLGIESPGLTSSLAIAEEVYRLLYK